MRYPGPTLSNIPDRNEIEFSRFVIRQFLIDVAERIPSDRIHVIAHSMCADATSRAIAELETGAESLIKSYWQPPISIGRYSRCKLPPGSPR